MADHAGTAGGSPAVPKARVHRGWHRRRYLPHFDVAGAVQMITYRLADALPRHVASELSHSDDAKNRKRAEALLDVGYGSCILRRPQVARVVVENWHHFDAERYRLLSWVVMPNHVHVLIEVIAGFSLSRIVHGWKSFTAKEIARHIRAPGTVWQEDYWDRAIRSEEHLASAVAYIINNPVTAGLVDAPERWPWSSAANTHLSRSSRMPKAMR